MDLVTALAAVHSLADLPAVVAALGHEPIWEEIPADTWLAGAAWRRSVERAAGKQIAAVMRDRVRIVARSSG